LLEKRRRGEEEEEEEEEEESPFRICRRRPQHLAIMAELLLRAHTRITQWV
jgi:hypothetical protein